MEAVRADQGIFDEEHSSQQKREAVGSDTRGHEVVDLTKKKDDGLVGFGRARRRESSLNKSFSPSPALERGTVSAPVPRMTTPVTVERAIRSAPPSTGGFFIPEVKVKQLQAKGKFADLTGYGQTFASILYLMNDKRPFDNFFAVHDAFRSFKDIVDASEDLTLNEVVRYNPRVTKQQMVFTINGDYFREMGFYGEEANIGVFSPQMTAVFYPEVTFWQPTIQTTITLTRI